MCRFIAYVGREILRNLPLKLGKIEIVTIRWKADTGASRTNTQLQGLVAAQAFSKRIIVESPPSSSVITSDGTYLAVLSLSFWRQFRGSKIVIDEPMQTSMLSVGIKGLPEFSTGLMNHSQIALASGAALPYLFFDQMINI